MKRPCVECVTLMLIDKSMQKQRKKQAQHCFKILVITDFNIYYSKERLIVRYADSKRIVKQEQVKIVIANNKCEGNNYASHTYSIHEVENEQKQNKAKRACVKSEEISTGHYNRHNKHIHILSVYNITTTYAICIFGKKY